MPHRLGHLTALTFLPIFLACGGDGPTSHSGPPKVISVSPANGAKGVARTTTISVSFSEPVRTSGSPFQLLGRSLVDGTTKIEGSRLTFTPHEPLAMGWTYTAVVTTAVEDTDGEQLEQQHVWSFSSGVDSAPEHLARRVTLGVAVQGERLDAAGDIDDFFISGTAGNEWVVFIQSAPNPPDGIQILLVDSLTGALVNSTFTPASYPQLEDWSLGRVVLPRTGTYLIRVRGEEEAGYTFRVDAINRAPESAPSVVTRGVAVSESIDRVADVDEFSFEAIAGEEFSMSLQLLSGMTSGLMLELALADYVHQRLEARAGGSTEVDLTTGRFSLPTSGRYTIRVYGAARGANEQKTGAYRFGVYQVDPRPENGAALQLDALPIAGAIDRNGDVDDYPFAGTAGQLVVLRLTAPLLQRERAQFIVYLMDESGTRYTSATAGASFDNEGSNYARRVALPHTGTWRARVQASSAWVPTTGSYELEAYTVSAAPEHVPSTVVVGQTVTGEQIDRPGDLDVFTFRGEAGREANLFLGWAETDEELYAHLGVLGMFTRASSLTLDGQSMGRFMMKDSTYTLAVDSHWAAQRHTMHSAGPYAFRLFPIDRRPEVLSAAYVIGDTVSSEVLYPSGDVDEYTFELAEQGTFDVFWDAPTDGTTGLVSGLLFTVGIDDSALGFSGFDGPIVRTITLPAGRYRLAVQNPAAAGFSDPFGTKAATQQYRFAITRKSSP